MLIHVVDPLVPGPPGTFECEDIEPVPALREVAWVPVPARLEARAIGSYLAEAAPSWLIRQVNCVLLGVAPGLRIDDRDWRVIHHRLEDRPVAVTTHTVANRSVSLSVDSSMHEDAGELLPSEILRDLLNRIRNADVLSMMGRPGAALPSHESLHYLGPDGVTHYNTFLRVGLALRSSDEYDRMAFWLADQLAGARAVLVDHWAMMGVAQYSADYANRLVSKRPQSASVTSLRRYDETEDELVSRLTRELSASDRRGLVTMISVYGSGQLADRLRNVAERLGASTDQVAICATPRAEGTPILTLAQLGEEFQPIEACEDCPTRRALVPIESDSYLLQLAAFTKYEAIRQPDASGARNFFEQLQCQGLPVACVHRTHATDGRHQAFYVDLRPLLTWDPFLGELRRTAEELMSSLAKENPSSPVDVILAPDHPVASDLAAVLGDIIGVIPIVADERRLDELDEADRRRLLEAESICVVDDVVISGGRLLGYRNRLIELRRRAGLPKEHWSFHLSCVVGVARPRHRSAMQGIRDITHHHQTTPRFFAVAELFLPNWDQRDCPWCWEYEKLTSLYPDVDQAPESIARRIARLANVGEGLVNGLFLGWSDPETLAESAVSEREWQQIRAEQGERADSFHWDDLNPGSVFGNVQQANLILSVASALQFLRSRPGRGDAALSDQPRLDESFRTPIAKILDPALYLYGRYYEAVLVAAILRAARCHDIRTPTDEEELKTMLRDHLLKAPASTELRSELALAMARGWLPRSETFGAHAVDPDPEAGIGDMLRNLLPGLIEGD